MPDTGPVTGPDTMPDTMPVTGTKKRRSYLASAAAVRLEIQVLRNSKAFCVLSVNNKGGAVEFAR